MDKKRVIVDYSTLPEDVLEIMANRYPYGYERDIINFPNAKGELISAVRVETDTTIYLVKVSKQLQQMVDDFETEEEELDSEDITATIAKNLIPKDMMMDDELGDDEEEDEYDTAEDDGDDDEDR